MNATAEAARHEPQVLCVVQRLLRSVMARHHIQKPPAAMLIWNQHSTRSGQATAQLSDAVLPNAHPGRSVLS